MEVIMVKLYGTKMSSAFRNHVLAKEIGLEYEEVPMDLAKDEQNSDEFLKLNPNGKVPCLVDGEFVLWESMAINNYLAAKHKPELLGDSPEDKALIDQWSYWGILEVQTHLFKMFSQKFSVPEDERDDTILQEAKDALPRLFKILDNHLSDRKYILGEAFTLADINMGTIVIVTQFVQYDISGYANISKWLKLLTDRPSFG